MFPNFIGVNEKFINLNSVALIEDRTEEETGAPIAVITTGDGAEIELIGTDADILFERVEMFVAATDELMVRLQRAPLQE